MTAITDATTVIETVIGRNLTGVQLRNIGNRYKAADPYSLIDENTFVDPDNPTDEELALFFLACIWASWQQVVGQSQRTISTASKQAEIESEVAAAVADLI
jgi:hypothetical protein